MARTITDLRDRRANTTCNACGAAGDDHVYGCANYRCPECGMSAGNHAQTCSVLAEILAKANTSPTLDGTTGAPIAGEPEGEEDDDAGSAGEESPAQSKPDEMRRVAPPEVTGEMVRDLQWAIEERKLVGVKQPLSRAILCGELHLVDGIEVGCCGVAAVAIVDERKCNECEKMLSKRLLALCIAHGARYAAGEAVDPQLKFQLELETE